MYLVSSYKNDSLSMYIFLITYDCDWPVKSVTLAVVYEDSSMVRPGLTSVLQPRHRGHCADRPPGARHHVLIVIIAGSGLSSLFRVSWCQVLSLMLLQLLLTITSGQRCSCFRVIRVYCSHRNERRGAPVPRAQPRAHTQVHIGETGQSDFLWSELCECVQGPKLYPQSRVLCVFLLEFIWCQLRQSRPCSLQMFTCVHILVHFCLHWLSLDVMGNVILASARSRLSSAQVCVTTNHRGSSP